MGRFHIFDKIELVFVAAVAGTVILYKGLQRVYPPGADVISSILTTGWAHLALFMQSVTDNRTVLLAAGLLFLAAVALLFLYLGYFMLQFSIGFAKGLAGK